MAPRGRYQNTQTKPTKKDKIHAHPTHNGSGYKMSQQEKNHRPERIADGATGVFTLNSVVVQIYNFSSRVGFIACSMHHLRFQTDYVTLIKQTKENS